MRAIPSSHSTPTVTTHTLEWNTRKECGNCHTAGDGDVCANCGYSVWVIAGSYAIVDARGSHDAEPGTENAEKNQ